MTELEYKFLFRFSRDSEKEPITMGKFREEFRNHPDFYDHQKEDFNSTFDELYRQELIRSVDGTHHERSEFVITDKGKSRFEYEKSKREKENKNPSPISLTTISDVKGPVFVHSPVSDANIETKVAPTVTPKKNISISKIIAILAGLITIILGIIFFYDRCN